MSPYSIEQYVLRLLANDRDYGTINKYLDPYSDMPSQAAKNILIQYIPYTYSVYYIYHYAHSTF